MVLGASGSIGNVFVKKLIKLNFKNLYLVDKNENDLTELNREIILATNNKSLNKIRYICADLNIMDMDSFLKRLFFTLTVIFLFL